MKLVWSPETASKAYIDTVKSCELFQESSVAELISAMAAGWNAKLIVETWSQGGVIATSVGLAIASRHTGGRHVCVVADDRSRSEYLELLLKYEVPAPDIVVGEPEEAMEGLAGIDFLVVDSRRRDLARVLRTAKLSSRGGVLVCKNANFSRSDVVGGSCLRWSAVDGGSRRIVRSVFLPVGKGVDIAHVAAGGSGGGASSSKWIKHIDRQSGEMHVIRK